MLKQKHDISDGLFGATGIYQKCLSNIHTEFLANDQKFLSLIKGVTPLPRVKINTNSFSNEAIRRAVNLFLIRERQME